MAQELHSLIFWKLKMTRRFFAVLLLLLSWQITYGQRITMLRSDVDSSRSSFITATYNFRIIVKLDSVKNCTGASFILWHNQSNYVIFSNYRVFDFSENGSSFVYSYTDFTKEIEYLYIGLLSGDTIGSMGWDSPRLIEIEFSVLPNAPHSGVVSFGIDNPEAVLSTDSGGKLVQLKNVMYDFNIHSFVEVWPGDANNDGKVSIDDVTRVGLYLGYGSRKPNFRSFKRPEASTNWTVQKCLAWDSAVVTFADCDGDGEITLNDFLVIPLNFGKSKSLPALDSVPETIIIGNSEKFPSPSGIPVKVFSTREVLAIAGELAFDFSEEKRISIFSNKAIEKNSLFYVNTTSDRIIFTIASLQENMTLNNLVVGYVVGNAEEISFPIIVKAISPNGEIFEAYLLPEETTEVPFTDESSNILNNIIFPTNLKVYSLIGEEVLSDEIKSERELFVKINLLQSGRYLLNFSDGKNFKTIKIQKE